MTESTRILLTTTRSDFVDTVTTTLKERAGRFSITTVPSASDGLDSLRTERFDCIVSAHDLPGKNGVEFLETVRETYSDLPFVLCPSDGSEAVAADAVAADVTGYLPRDDSTAQQPTLGQRIADAVTHPGVSSADDRHGQRGQVLEAVPECIVQLDADGRVVYANRRAETVFGSELSVATERTCDDPEWEVRDADSDTIPDAWLPFRQVRDSGEPVYDARRSIRWPDGSETILLASATPLFDDDGAVESVVFSLRDASNEAGKNREPERYEQMVEHLDDIATIVDPNGTIKYVSPAVSRVLGYEPHELTGKRRLGCQPPETRKAIADAIEDVVTEPSETRTIRTQFQRADGSSCWVESTFRNRVDNDAIDGILVSSREVSEQQKQKRRERQLSTLHEATRQLLDSQTPQQVAATASKTAVEVLDFELNGIHFYDTAADGLVPIAVSDACRELFDEVPVIDEGLAWETFRTGEPRIYDDLDDVSEVYNAETPVQSEMYLPLADLGVFMISATEPAAFEDTDVEFGRLLAANTEAALKRIRKERQLQSREAELKQQNERLDEFASIVSHDLRNPLNVAQLRIEYLSKNCDSKHLQPTKQALDRMEELISDTLTLAQQGNVVAETEPIQLNELVDNCWESVSTGEATLESADVMTITGDWGRLQHVFENLFRNAIEHGGPDVTVRVGRIADDGIYVEDNGTGIPDADREAVFEPGHTSATDGTGFGLTIVKRIAEAHGWEVAIASGADGGARFEFTGVEIDD